MKADAKPRTLRSVCNAAGTLKACPGCSLNEPAEHEERFLPPNRHYPMAHTRHFQCLRLTAATYHVRLIEVMHASGV